MCRWMVNKLINKIGPFRHMTHLCSHFIPSTAPTRYRISEKIHITLKKKEQEGQHDYPLSNHLRCDTMWSPSPSRSPLPLPSPAPPSRSPFLLPPPAPPSRSPFRSPLLLPPPAPPSRSPLLLPPPAPPSRSHWNPSYAYDAWYLPLHKLQEEQLQASGTKINSGFICGTIIRNYWLIIHKKIMFLLSSIPGIVPLKVWTVFLIIFYGVTNLHIFHSPL